MSHIIEYMGYQPCLSYAVLGPNCYKSIYISVMKEFGMISALIYLHHKVLLMLVFQLMKYILGAESTLQ